MPQRCSRRAHAPELLDGEDPWTRRRSRLCDGVTAMIWRHMAIPGLRTPRRTVYRTARRSWQLHSRTSGLRSAGKACGELRGYSVRDVSAIQPNAVDAIRRNVPRPTIVYNGQ
jgi:hypothetical protein